MDKWNLVIPLCIIFEVLVGFWVLKPSHVMAKHVAAKVAHADCISYPYLADTMICKNKLMYHIEGSHWAFMADLSKPHSPVSPIPDSR